MYKAIDIDKKKLTLMGVKFSDLQTLENTANAIGSNMFEGFKPTPQRILLIRDYIVGKITLSEFVKLVKDNKYA